MASQMASGDYVFNPQYRSAYEWERTQEFDAERQRMMEIFRRYAPPVEYRLMEPQPLVTLDMASLAEIVRVLKPHMAELEQYLKTRPLNAALDKIFLPEPEVVLPDVLRRKRRTV